MRKTAVCLLLALSPSLMSAATGYFVHNLVADVPGVADFTDPNLVNAWGIAISATSPFWVCDAGTGLSTVYTVSNSASAAAFGAISTLKPSVPGAGSNQNGVCTGIVANPVSTAFLFSSPAVTTPRAASFIFDTLDGTISAWSNAVDSAHAIVVVDNSANAVYTGLAIVGAPTTQLYAANFHTGTIDVFDGNFKPVTLAAGSFIDSSVPAGFAPFNITNLGGNLYVTYAKQDAAGEFDVQGTGNGYVAVFDPTGKLVRHLISGGALNSPWGIAIAPATFGKFAGSLLVGNFGDGLINAYDFSSGAFLGPLQDQLGSPLVIPGLWALTFGNGGSGGDKDALYFAAGPGAEKHGLLGSIQANPSLVAGQVTNAAQSNAGIAGNTWLALVGTNLAATKRLWQASDFVGNKLPTTLDGVTVTVNGEPAYILYISPVQINILTPSDLPTSGNAVVVVSNNGLTTDSTAIVNLQPVAPSFFLINSDKYIAARHADNVSIVGPTTLIPNATTPAAPNETIVLYGNAFGATNPAIVNGQVVSAAAPLVTQPTVQFNGVSATVVFAGISATGLYQLNVTVPAGLPDGDVRVSAQVGSIGTPVGAFIAVKN